MKPGNRTRYLQRSTRVRIPWCSALWFALLVVSPASGQELFGYGMELVAQGLQRGAVVNVSGSVSADSDDRCTFRTQILEAEAERALRRDGIAAQPLAGGAPSRANRYWTMEEQGDQLAALLAVDVIAFSTGVQQCAVSLVVQLQVLGISPGQDVVILAANDRTLLVWAWPEHVGRVRAVVEEKVSVIANAIRSRGVR